MENWALITGAPRGFCRAIAKILMSEGYNIVVHGRDRKTLEKFSTDIAAKYNRTIFPIALDALDPKSPSLLMKILQESRIAPKVIIHHLGGPIGIKSSMAPIEDWMRVLQLNVLFSINLNNLLMEGLKSHDFARIVNVGSVSATSLRGSGPYACSKALLLAYTKTLGRELGKTNIVVSYLSLGAFETENSNWKKYKNGNQAIVDDFLRHHQASGRLGKPDEIGVVIRMLISSEFTFGQGAILEYDGGTM